MALFDHGRFLAVIKQLLADLGSVHIQKDQNNKSYGNRNKGIPKLGASVVDQ